MTPNLKLVNHLGFSFCILLAAAACEPGTLREGLGPDDPAAGTPLPPGTTSPAELPRVYLTTDYVAPTGQTLTVPAGGDLQAALDAAGRGDEIVLEAGASYVGSFTLPAKPGSGWIVVRSSAMGSLPGAGQRVSPADGAAMPKIVTAGTTAAIATAPGASHYRLMGLEITATPGVTLNFGLVRLEDLGATAAAELPSDIILDRVYVHGQPQLDLKRCVALNSAASAVIDSYLAECHHRGYEAQAIMSWNSPGPLKIVNNYLEGAGENILFGGAAPSVPGLVGSDIEIRHNHFYKPVSWMESDPSYAGKKWVVKNLFESKAARRVLFEANVLEHSWVMAQVGYAILLKASNSGAMTWAETSDVTIRYNLIRHAAGGVSIANTAQPTARVSIEHNLFTDIGAPRWGTNGMLFQVLGSEDLRVAHNTGFATKSFLTFSGALNTRFAATNNIVALGTYGVSGSGTGLGTSALQAYAPGYQFLGNVLIGDTRGANYPPRNIILRSPRDVGFVDAQAGQYELSSASRLHRSAGQPSPGADVRAIIAATRRVVSH